MLGDNTKGIAMTKDRVAYPLYSALALGASALIVLGASVVPASSRENAGVESSLPRAERWIDPAERDCLAEAVYFEARSEPRTGQVAVAHVVLNRAASEGHPNRVCEVIREGENRGRGRCQFSWRCDGLADIPRDKRAWAEAQALAVEVMLGHEPDPTRGALFYHTVKVKPAWAPKLERVAQIGTHVFYLGERKV